MSKNKELYTKLLIDFPFLKRLYFRFLYKVKFYIKGKCNTFFSKGDISKN